MYDYFNMDVPEKDINQHGSLSLAYLGDAVYELLVRAWLLRRPAMKTGELHKEAVEHVKAAAQARLAERLVPVLTEEEEAVFRRGRNTRVNSVPHSADISQYHAATGLECLFGYLYLRGRTDRLCELFDMAAGED